MSISSRFRCKKRPGPSGQAVRRNFAARGMAASADRGKFCLKRASRARDRQPGQVPEIAFGRKREEIDSSSSWHGTPDSRYGRGASEDASELNDRPRGKAQVEQHAERCCSFSKGAARRCRLGHDSKSDGGKSFWMSVSRRHHQNCKRTFVGHAAYGWFEPKVSIAAVCSSVGDAQKADVPSHT